MHQAQLKELLLQSLEHERGSVQVYEIALQSVLNAELQHEFQEYLAQTRNHERVLLALCGELGIDAEEGSPGRQIVRQFGAALVHAMQEARGAGNPAEAELIACECVVLAETKDHANWGLLGQCVQHADARHAELLQSAVEEVEPEEDEHLYHSRGWVRELRLESLGLKAVLPPPEERRHAGGGRTAARGTHGGGYTLSAAVR